MSNLWSAPAGSVVPFRKPRGNTTARSVIVRNVSNLPIRVPAVDWPRLVTGEKRMFRTYAHGENRLALVIPPDTVCPRPCLIYTQRGHERQWVMAPAILESFRREPIGAISSEDLATEGFEYMPAFRYYWTNRYKKIGWRPWDEVTVIELSPMRDGSRDWAARWLYGQVFGEVTNA